MMNANEGSMLGRPKRSLVERLIGAALLKADVYEEIEADTTATPAAAVIVVLASVAAGIGAYGTSGLAGLAAGIASGLILWAAWAWLTYFIGTKMLPAPETSANWGELARTLAFAQAPRFLTALALVPAVGGLIALIAGIWGIAASLVAIRTALDYNSTWRAVGVFVLALVPLIIISIAVLLGLAAIFGAEAVGLTTETAS